MQNLILNGWAASANAWSLCETAKDAPVFSYIDQLDGKPEAALSAATDGALLVGWSMGGSGALRLACRFPEKVKGLVLVAATPRMMEEKETLWRGMSPRRLKALEYGLKATHGEGFFGVPAGKPNPYQMDSDENLARGLDYLRTTDLRAALERLSFTAPVYIFQSERDGIVRADNAAFLKRVFPQAVVEIVPGGEHALPIVIPEKIDAAVTAIRSGR